MITHLVPNKAIRKQYSAEFKDRAVNLAKQVGVPQAALDLGIPSAMLYSWRTLWSDCSF